MIDVIGKIMNLYAITISLAPINKHITKSKFTIVLGKQNIKLRRKPCELLLLKKRVKEDLNQHMMLLLNQWLNNLPENQNSAVEDN